MTVGGARIVLRALGLAAARPRALLVAGAIAVGTSLPVALVTLEGAATAALRGALAAGSAGVDLRIAAAEGGLEPRDLVRARGTGGVALASPLVRGTVATAGATAAILEVIGIDLLEAASGEAPGGRVTSLAASRLPALAGDPLSLLTEPGAALAPRALARRHGWRLGHAVPVMTPAGERRVVVHGLLRAAPSDGARLVMDLPAAQGLLGRGRRLDAIDVVLRPGADPLATAAALRRAVPAALDVLPPGDLGAERTRMLTAFRALAETAALGALLLGAFLAASATASVMIATRWERGVLRATGASPRQLLTAAVGYAAVLGLAGAALGVTAAAALGGRLEVSVLQALELRLGVPLADVEARAGVGLLALGIVGGVGAALGGAALPAWHAARGAIGALWRPAESRPSRHRTTTGVGALLLVVVAGAPVAAVPAWGGLVLVLVGGALLVPTTLTVTSALLARSLRRVGGRASLVAASAHSELADRMALPVGGLAGGIAFVLVLAAMQASVDAGVRDLLARQLRGALVVTSTRPGAGWLPAPLAGALAAELRALPGVARVVTLRMREMRFRGGRVHVRAVGHATADPARAAALVVAGDPRAARRALERGSGVLASTSLARRHRLELGERLRLETPRGVLVLPLVATLHDLSSPHGSLTLGAPLYRRWWKDDLVNVFEVELRSQADVAAAAAAIERRFAGAHALRVRVAAEHRRTSLARIARAFGIMRAAALLALVVTVLALADAFGARSLERRPDLALWRAVGAAPREAAAGIVLEAAALGGAGGVVGVLWGAVVARGWLAARLMPLVGLDVPLAFPWMTAATLVPSAAVAAAAAALVPAARALRGTTLAPLRTA